MTLPPDEGLTEDAFLGGRLRLLQPARGYRAGMDPVLLAAAVPARPGETVLDLGCGVGTALYCLAARVEGLVLAGLEMQPDYAALARRNAAANGLAAGIFTGDVSAPPPPLAAVSAHHVLANPPWFAPGSAPPSGEGGRAGGRHEAVPLADWFATGTRRLRPGGSFTMIQRAERLAEILAGCAGAGLGSLVIRPLAARPGRAAERVIVSGRKGGRTPLILAAPLILHEGDRHMRDGESFTAPVQAILRDAAALPPAS